MFAACSRPAAPEAPVVAQKTAVVDVYTDLVCPWCFIGTERLDQAIAQSGVKVELRHHAFLLNPDVPPDGIDVAQHLRDLGRDPSQAFAQVEAFAHQSGIALDLSKQPRMHSTAFGHALLAAAAAKGTQRALERDLFRAHFMESKNIADAQVLTELAQRHGFTADEVETILQDANAQASVRREAQEASSQGVRGVPFFIFGNGQRFSGAQSVETIRAALEASAR
jgi:predicted DsbA family dithiol-disulfide isomerase